MPIEIPQCNFRRRYIIPDTISYVVDEIIINQKKISLKMKL